jgi:ABC-2 type transport system ATP-binding protein
VADTLIDVHAARRTYGSFVAVDDADLDVRAGEIVGLLGANGAGKTTLITMVLGLLRPDSGSIAVLGSIPTRRTRTQLGYMPQGLGLYTELTVRQNVEFVAGAFGVRDIPPLPSTIEATARRQVASIGLGLQRQLAFFCALLHEPRLLVLDEPTSGVDPLTRARLWDTIHNRRDEGVGVLVTTHYMQEAEQCDRLVLMSRGRVVATGTLADLLDRHRVSQVEGGSWASSFDALSTAGLPVTLAGRSVRVAGTPPDDVRAALAAAGIEAAVRESAATLEEVMVLLDRP